MENKRFYDCNLVRGAIWISFSNIISFSSSIKNDKFMSLFLEEIKKNDMDLSKTKLRIEMKGFGFMYNNNIKPIYNYDLQECNLLFKKGIHPIGCGVGNKDGRVYHVFMADKKYFNAVSLIKYEQMDK